MGLNFGIKLALFAQNNIVFGEVHLQVGGVVDVYNAVAVGVGSGEWVGG